jgi:hypothetical protein
MKTKILILGLVLFLATAAAVTANGVVDLPRQVLSGGASDFTGGGGITLRATFGQPVVGGVVGGGGDVSLGQGFWCGGAQGYSIYLPLVVRDFQS